MTVHKLRSWRPWQSQRSATVNGEVPEEFLPFVVSVTYWKNGASLELTRAGLDLGRSSFAGAERLAQVVMGQAGWLGTRSGRDVAREVRDHCWAWFWLPPLRGRANPIDLEFYVWWPLNLLVSMRLMSGDAPKASP